MGDDNLPKGSMYDPFFGYIPDEYKAPEVKCTCGVSITMGKDDHIDYHSSYCDLKPKKIDENK